MRAEGILFGVIGGALSGAALFVLLDWLFGPDLFGQWLYGLVGDPVVFGVLLGGLVGAAVGSWLARRAEEPAERAAR